MRINIKVSSVLPPVIYIIFRFVLCKKFVFVFVFEKKNVLKYPLIGHSKTKIYGKKNLKIAY